MSLPVVLQRVKALGYKVFDGDADYDLNIVGIRSKDTTANTFNDLMPVSYKVKGQWYTRSGECTTDPGSHKLGKHRGQYNALVQTGGKVKVYRDSDKDETFDQDSATIDEGYFGINIHRANSRNTSRRVDKWSAGCQVFANPNDFAEFIKLCRKQVSVNGWGSFSYTLIEEW